MRLRCVTGTVLRLSSGHHDEKPAVWREVRAILWRLPTNSAGHSRRLESSDCACLRQVSALYADFRIVRLTENMRLSSLRNNPNATETALHFPNYLLRLGEGSLETAEDGMLDS